jgi:hypothetical protein
VNAGTVAFLGPKAGRERARRLGFARRPPGSARTGSRPRRDLALFPDCMVHQMFRTVC